MEYEEHRESLEKKQIVLLEAIKDYNDAVSGAVRDKAFRESYEERLKTIRSTLQEMESDLIRL